MMEERVPKLKLNFIPNIETTGAKEGFTTITGEGRAMSANYNNKGRFVIKTFDPLVSLLPTGIVKYSDYIKDPKAHSIKMTKFGLIARIYVLDAETNQEMVMFLGADKVNNALIGRLGELIFEEFERYGVTPETVENHVWEVGKKSLRNGNGQMWYINHVGTRDEVKLLLDPLSLQSEIRKENMLKSQPSTPAVPEIQNFVLNDDEVFLIQKLNDLGKVGKIKTASREGIAATLEKGYGGKKTSRARSSFIAMNAEKFGIVDIKIEEEVVKNG